MHCVAALHSPVPPQLQCTALDTAADGTCWSGAADGSITRWQKQQQDGASAAQPVALLQGHAHPVVALLSGLTAAFGSFNSSSGGSSGGGVGSYLLSLDAEGWVGLWDCSSWVCLDMTRAAPLPPGCSPTLLLMPDGDHVCIIVPATPSLQQEQSTLWQHQRTHQQQQAAAHPSSSLPSPTPHPLPHQQHPHQQQQSGPGAATAANLSPMMLVLRWASLALVSAPLVSNLGLAALTSSSVSLGDQGDAVVAAAVLQTQPALAPAAADSVVLAVMRSGWMWAGSLAGSSLSQAWEKPLVPGVVSAPLRQGCLWTTFTSSSSGRHQQQQDAAGALQLQLLLVQPDGWRLLVCSSFSSLDGMPQHWVQLAAQQQLLLREPGGQSCMLSNKGCGIQGSAAATADASGSGVPQRVRFELQQQGCGGVAAAGASSDSSSPHSSWSSSSSSSSGGDSEGESGREEEAGAESDGSVAGGRQGSRLQRVSGPHPQRRQHKRQQHVPQLLGGAFLQPVGVSDSSSSSEAWQQQQQQEGAAVAVLVWLDSGQQQLWSVPLLAPTDTQEGMQQQQRQLVQLVQQIQLQPWPAHAAVKLFAAVNALHNSVALLTQHSRHTPHHHGHHAHRHHHTHQQHQQQQQLVSGSSLSSADVLLDNAAPQMWNLHCLQLLAAGQPQQPAPQQQRQLQPQGHLSCLSVQQLPWQLHHCQGSWADAWAMPQPAYSTDSSTGDHSSNQYWDTGSSLQHTGSTPQQQLRQQASSSSHDGADATGADAMQVDAADNTRQGIGNGSSSCCRKRPAVGEPATAESESTVAGVSGQECATGAASGCRIKQARVQEDAAGAAKKQQATAGQAGSGWVGQQQQVTHMLLLGSDCPGLHQLAVILASGTILFYDLATYCVPGAAGHPDCCCVGAGHMGRVSTTLEVTFKCPPQHLLGYPGPVGAGTGAAAGADPMHGGSLPRPVSWHFSSTAARAGESSARSSQDGGYGYAQYCADSSSGNGGNSRPCGQQQQYQQFEAVECPAAAQGWCRRPAGGGVVPLLLTGATDGSLRGWNLRMQQLGHTWMAAHPHTAPVEAIVLPPVSSRLPWSTCVLSVCTAGRVALTCLASGSTTRTFDGWSLGPPAQLAWSTGRGLLAAGGWDAAGVWQVAVWDTYSGQLDRLLQGAAAHMLMAALGQELTSSMRHLSRSAQAQQTQATSGVAAGTAGAAGLSSSGVTTPQYSSSLSASGGQQRASLDVPIAGSQAASADGAKGSSSEAAGFTPRLQLVRHSGPIQAVPGSRPDVLMLDIDVQQLVAQLGAYSKQQRRENSSRQRQQQAGSAFNRTSMDVDSHSTPSASARASRASSLDLVGLVQQGSQGSGEVSLLASAAASTRTSPQQQIPAPAGITAGQMHAGHHAASAGMSRQASLASAVATTAGEQTAAQSSAQAGMQERPVHARRAMVPAVAAALQGLCVLHKWGLEPKLDQQLLLLLQQLQGWPEPAATQLLTQRSSSTLLPQSPTTPSTARAVSTATVGGFARLAEHISTSGQGGGAAAVVAQPNADGAQEQLMQQLRLHLLHGPAAGSPVLKAGAPCLSQEVLLSPCCNASVVTVPRVRSSAGGADSYHSQEQQHSGELQLAAGCGDGQAGGLSVAGDGQVIGSGRKPGGVAAGISNTNLMLLTACPSLLSARLLTLVALSKWLMASVTSHTSVNTCSGLVTLYALHSSELLTQAAAAQAAATAPSSLQQQATTSPTPTNSSPGAQEQLRKQPHQQKHAGLSHAARDPYPTPPIVPDLLLISSTALACPGLLAEAAQLLMAALLHPAAPGTFLLPTMAAPYQQQQLGWAGRGPVQMQQQDEDSSAGEQVFTSPGAAAAASCWPPAVLQLAVLQAQQMQPQQQGSEQPLQGNSVTAALSLQQLPKWMPLLVLSAAAAVAHPTRMPPEVLAAVSAGLLDVLLGAAPAHSSCVAASWLSQVLHGGHWAVWRPCLGKPGHLVHRLCHLIDRLQANSTDSRSAASHLVSQSLSSTPGLLHPASMQNNSSSGANPNPSTSTASDFTLLLQQPYAVADPLGAVTGIGRGLSSAASTSSSSQAAGWGGGRIPSPQHVEGGLFLSAALMGPATSRGGSPYPGGSLSRSVSPAAVGSLLEGSPSGRGVGGAGSGAWGGSGSASAAGGSQLEYSSSTAGQQHPGMQPVHSTSTGLTYSYAGGHGHGMAVVGAGSGQGSPAGLGSVREQQQVSGGQVSVSRSVLVVWLRAALDVLAALMHVDPAAVLMELSHKLAAPSAESSGTSLTLLLAAVSRLLKRPSERPGLLPHLGFIAALAVQALDPNRAQLRHTLLQPAMGVVRDLASHFPQVDCHSSSLQVAVGSTRGLAPGLGSAAGGAAGGVVQAPTVAVFDMNGGTKKRVLLLPVLMDDQNTEQQFPPPQQQQGGDAGGQGQQHAPAGPAGSTRHMVTAGHVGPFGSTNSLHSTASTTSNADNTTAGGQQGLGAGGMMSGALPGLWSSAEGVAVPAGAAAGRQSGHTGHSGGWGGVLGGSSSSLSSSTAFDTPGESRSSSFGRLAELQRASLGGNTMTRAEAAMLEGWFGGSPGGSDDGALSSSAAGGAPSRLPEGQQAVGREGIAAAAAGSGGYGVGGMPRGRAPSSLQCGVIYPDASMAASPVLCASEVSGGVAAVAFSPGGDAVAAFVLESYCLVVWRLGGSWTQRLAHLGSSRPMSQLPHAYIRLPTAALLVNAVFKDGAAGQQQQQQRHHRHHHHHGESEGGELLQWQLKWQTHSHIDLLYHGCLCGSVEVHL